MTLDDIRVALQVPGKLFDTGYDDCLEGRIPRLDDEKYMRGYKLATQMRDLRYGKHAHLGLGRKD